MLEREVALMALLVPPSVACLCVAHHIGLAPLKTRIEMEGDVGRCGAHCTLQVNTEPKLERYQIIKESN